MSAASLGQLDSFSECIVSDNNDNSFTWYQIEIALRKGKKDIEQNSHRPLLFQAPIYEWWLIAILLSSLLSVKC